MTTDILHIHAQQYWHQPAYLLGTVDALLALRDTIDAALAANRPEGMQTFCRDGEGYTVVVIPVTELTDADALPYVSPYEGWMSSGDDPHQRLSDEDERRIFGRGGP